MSVICRDCDQPRSGPRALLCAPCRIKARRARNARCRAKAIAEDRAGINEYARTYYRNRHPTPPCTVCGVPVRHGCAKTCDNCCESLAIRIANRESQARRRQAKKDAR